MASDEWRVASGEWRVASDASYSFAVRHSSFATNLSACRWQIAAYFLEQSLQHFAGAYFNYFGAAIGDHLLHGLRPAHRGGELLHEVHLDLLGIAHGRCGYVLIHGTNRCCKRGGLYGCLELNTRRLHQRTVEGTAHLQLQRALGAGSGESRAC